MTCFEFRAARVWRAVSQALVVGMGASVLISCDDPTETRRPPIERRLSVIFHMVGGEPVQPLHVAPFDRDSILGLRAEIRSVPDGQLLAVAYHAGFDNAGRPQTDPCQARLNAELWSPNRDPAFVQCYVFDFEPEGGRSYELVVQADDRPTARGVTTVPDPFEITSATAEGDPPGTERLAATWTRSITAFRYVVSIRKLGLCGTHCNHVLNGWFTATRDTAILTVATDVGSEGGSGWAVDVYALDQALYDYLTSGSQYSLFPVPPSSNVQGGFGVVGSWVAREWLLDQ